jgi:BirA family transcriptional regulator, biotin operon repressor / biotin---[acetyl-CoA-carboxylase] ligase
MGSDENPYAWVARELAGSAFASIAYVAATESTNDDAASLLGDARFAGHTIVAEFQRRGAGRKGRAWLARAGTALLCTTILPREIATQNVWIVPYWAGLAVRNALLTCGVPAAVHWPNDLLLHDRKLGGVLCQSRITGAAAWVACGVGINVYRQPGAEAGIDPPPAFCDDVAPIERGELLQTILAEYGQTLELLDDPRSVAARWEAAAGFPGRRYTILKEGAAAPFTATAQRLAAGGGLVVARDDGALETVALADARALR